MCGRAYSTYSEEELRLRYLNKKKIKIPDFGPNYNLSPTQALPIVRADGIELLRWGLIPSWAKDHKIAQINARSETAAEKPMFRSAFKARRCIIPLSGFVEWKRDGDSKRPFKIFQADEPIMSVAGLWEHWISPGGEVAETFCVLTTGPNALMEKIHDRMPVILDDDAVEIWLDAKAKPEALQKLMKPCPAKWLRATEISTLINSPKNNRPEVLDEIA